MGIKYGTINLTNKGEMKMLLLTINNTNGSEPTVVNGCDFEEICLKSFTADELQKGIVELEIQSEWRDGYMSEYDWFYLFTTISEEQKLDFTIEVIDDNQVDELSLELSSLLINR